MPLLASSACPPILMAPRLAPRAGFPSGRGAAEAPPSGYRMAKNGTRGEVYLYGPIGRYYYDGVSAKQFAADLKALGKVTAIDLRINSEGGDVFDGKTIYTLLRDHGATVTAHVDGLAASAASFIAMAGDEILMAEGAFMMIHNAWSFAVGDAAELRRYADLLDTVNGTVRDVYVARTGQTADAIRAWMDDETWFTAAEAVEHKFATRIVENLKAAASLRIAQAKPQVVAKFRHLPAALRPQRAAALAKIGAMRASPAVAAAE